MADPNPVKSDIRWFHENPARLYRIRPRAPGEFDIVGLPETIEGKTCLTVALRLPPHHSARHPVLLPSSAATPPDTDAAAEHLLEKYGHKVAAGERRR